MKKKRQVVDVVGQRSKKDHSYLTNIQNEVSEEDQVALSELIAQGGTDKVDKNAYFDNQTCKQTHRRAGHRNEFKGPAHSKN